MPAAVPVLLLLLLLLHSVAGSLPAVWTRLYTADNCPRIVYKPLSTLAYQYKELRPLYQQHQEGCRTVKSRLPTTEEAFNFCFNKFLSSNESFHRLKLKVWWKSISISSSEPATFFVQSESPMRVAMVTNENTEQVLTQKVFNPYKAPNIIVCVEQQITTAQPTTTTATTTAAATTTEKLKQSVGSSACDCVKIRDLAWPVASVICLSIICLCLATALLLACRRGQKKQTKTGDSIPRTSSSLMEFHHQQQQQEKAQPMMSQTLPRRPRVIHHGQVHTNGYLTLGSIQARKQREIQRQLGLSEPPSPNHSLARSDCRH